ncbi:MAG TPA: recombinase family protein [Solirubrobacteraceae bacterium]
MIYAAKSTEDVRGSLGTQLADCRSAIASRGSRVVVAEFDEEAVSAFTRSRGEALEEAMRVAASLAADHRGAELWVQHSDRLARGDGKRARHVVEIALWALKADVSVCSVQDPDTFRDLLYAVVTGQRNHEDSKRKGAASAAGKRRAAVRGDYAGSLVDGFRVAVDVDERGFVTKRAEIDPTRKPLFDLMFRLARRGESPSAIASRLNARGWLTKPAARAQSPVPFTAQRVIVALSNPRYAGLSFYKGEILGPAKSPRYITPGAWQALQDHPRRARRPTGLPQEPFLLRRLLVCRVCGSGMISVPSPPRLDGTRRRDYICHRHLHGHCAAGPVEAGAVEHSLIAALGRYLTDQDSRTPHQASVDEPPSFNWKMSAPSAAPIAEHLRARIRGAVADGDDTLVDELLNDLADHRRRQPGLNGVRSDRSGYEHALLRDFNAWSADLFAGRALEKAETHRLNAILRRLFDRIEIETASTNVHITPIVHAEASSKPAGERPITVDKLAWRAAVLRTGQGHRARERWTDNELVFALKQWALINGRSPVTTDWARATTEYPHAHTIYQHFGTWSQALRAAQLTPAPRRADRRRPSRDPRTGRYLRDGTVSGTRV